MAAVAFPRGYVPPDRDTAFTPERKNCHENPMPPESWSSLSRTAAMRQVEPVETAAVPSDSDGETASRTASSTAGRRAVKVVPTPS